MELIICRDRELNMIREVILNTPLRWEADLDHSIILNHAVPTLIGGAQCEVGL